MANLEDPPLSFWVPPHRRGVQKSKSTASPEAVARFSTLNQYVGKNDSSTKRGFLDYRRMVEEVWAGSGVTLTLGYGFNKVLKNGHPMRHS